MYDNLHNVFFVMQTGGLFSVRSLRTLKDLQASHITARQKTGNFSKSIVKYICGGNMRFFKCLHK